MDSKTAIGLMSGTSTDGIDAVLVEISGHGINTAVTEKSFISIPYEAQTRARLLELVQGQVGGAEEFCKVNFLLGILFAEACEKLCAQAQISFSEIALVHPAQRELLARLCAKTKDHIVVALRNPYDAWLPEISTAFMTYGYERISQLALLDILSGKACAEGTFPFKIKLIE